MNPKILYSQLNSFLTCIGNSLQSVLLLIVRLYWGWQFFLTGKGKLMNLQRTSDYFATLHIPAPTMNAILAGSTECFGGLLLLLGLGSRIITVPLICTMTVAYLTADLDKVKGIFSDPDKFVSADPFQFLFAALLVFIFGPGRFALDSFCTKKIESQG